MTVLHANAIDAITVLTMTVDVEKSQASGQEKSLDGVALSTARQLKREVTLAMHKYKIDNGQTSHTLAQVKRQGSV
jgi:hypothetical protein